MQPTSPSIADQLATLAFVVPYTLLILALIGGVVRAFVVYLHWLRQQPLSKRATWLLWHFSFLPGLVYLYLTQNSPSEGFAVFVAILTAMNIMAHVFVLGIAGSIHGIVLIHKGFLAFRGFRWWQKVLTVAVPLDLVWCLVQRG